MATTAKIAKDMKLERSAGHPIAKAENKPGSPCCQAATATAAGAAAARARFLRKFGICRLCFRQLALNGEIPGVTKASW